MRDLSGLSAEELAGAGWLRAVHPDDVEHVRQAWRDAIEHGTPYQVQYRIRRSDGSWRTHLVRAQPFRDRDGAILKWFGTATDINDQFEITQQYQAIVRRLSATLESVTDAFILVAHDWRVAFANSHATRMLGQSPQSLVGSDIWHMLPALRGTRVDEECRRAIRDG